MIRLAGVHEIDTIWPLLEKGMAEACRRGRGTADPYWLWTICRRSEAMLFYVLDGQTVKAGCVCEVQNVQGERVLKIHALCGMGSKEWLKELSAYAANFLHVTKGVFEGRPGWGRLPGVKLVRSVYEVDLINAGQ